MNYKDSMTIKKRILRSTNWGNSSTRRSPSHRSTKQIRLGWKTTNKRSIRAQPVMRRCRLINHLLAHQDRISSSTFRTSRTPSLTMIQPWPTIMGWIQMLPSRYSLKLLLLVVIFQVWSSLDSRLCLDLTNLFKELWAKLIVTSRNITPGWSSLRETAMESQSSTSPSR